MSINNWYAFYVGDYMRDTAHLSVVEHGAYRLLLDHYYSTASPLPDNLEQLYRICRAFAEQEQSAIKKVVQLFFVHDEDNGVYFSKRVEKELQKKGDISKKRSEAAKNKGLLSKAKANQLMSNCKAIDDTSTSTSTSIDNKIEIDKSISLSVFDENTPKAKKDKKMDRGSTLIGFLSTLDDPDEMPKEWYQDTKTNFVGATTDDILAEYNKFCDYWEANSNQAKGKKASWKAAWRLWFSNYWERRK